MRSPAATLALLVLAAPLHADEVQTVVTRYVAWRGGTSFERLSSFHERGDVRRGGLHGTFEQWLVRDGRVRRDSTLGSIPSAEAATATTAWTTNTSGQIEDLGNLGESDRRAPFLAFAHRPHS